MCSLLLSNGMQLEQTLQLTLNSDGPLRGVMAISTGSGNVKGYVGSPQIGDMPLYPESRWERRTASREESSQLDRTPTTEYSLRFDTVMSIGECRSVPGGK
jgi:hypothetical protein